MSGTKLNQVNLKGLDLSCCWCTVANMRLVLNVKHINGTFHLVGVRGHGWAFGVPVLLITTGSLKDAARLKPLHITEH